MARKNLINLDQQEAELKRILKDIEKKKKEADGILKRDLPAAKTAVYEYLEKLALLGVAEDCKATLLHVAYTRGDKGVRLPILRKVIVDQVQMDDARKELGSAPYNAIEDGETVEKVGKGFLREQIDGNSTTIFITEKGKAALQPAEA